MTTHFETTFFAQGIEIINGSVGIGRLGDKWEIQNDSNSLHFIYDGEVQACIVAAKEKVNPNFIGKSRCLITESCNVETIIGLIVSFTGSFYNIDMTQTPDVKGVAPTPTIILSCVPRDTRVFGVISGLENYSRECSFGTFQTILDQEDGINRILVSSLGVGMVWVCDYNSNVIEAGSYVTTSPVKGYGMLQSDDIKHSYTVAKISQKCVFKPKQIILQRPIAFEDNGPIYEPLTTDHGEVIRDYEYRLKYIDENGNSITAKHYEDSLHTLVKNIRDMSLTYEEKIAVALKDPKRTVFKACLLGCVYCC